MSVWNPEYKVLIDGLDLTDVTLVGLTIQTGRNNVFNQPQAGYCNVQLINTNNTNYNFNINSGLTIEIKDSSNVYIPLFGGRISDISESVNSTGSSGLTTRIDIIAIGGISKLYKAIWTASLAKADDGDQIFEMLTQLFINSWNEVSPAETWNTYPAAQTWATAEDIGLGEIDRPGQYEMEQRSASATDYYSLVAQIANSALGYIYEDAQGNVGYADAQHRQNYLGTNGYVVLDAGAAYGAGLRTTVASGNIVNKYVLNYGNNYGSQVTATNQDSINSYGLYEINVQSNIHNSTDATNVANRQIDLRAYPRPLFDSITFPLQNPELGSPERDDLLNIFMGLPVKITNLPPVFGGGEFTGYVEGWTFRSTVNGLTLSMTVSPTEFSAVAQNWSEVNAAETWNSILNTLEWQDAIGVIS